MSSGFYPPNLSIPEGEWLPVEGMESERFDFFKVRLYGNLHFVKKIKPEFANDLFTSEALRKEFTLGYPLTHPGIVRYMRFEGDALYEDYVDGMTLRELIDSNDLRLQRPEFITELCRQLLEATDYLHMNGIIHMDLKPENVMIARIGNQVKIIDLGCACSASCDSTTGYTPKYRAPEQDGNSSCNITTDIYLIGKIMQELTAHTPHKRRWSRFIEKATAPKPADRFQSARKALDAIPCRHKRKSAWLFPLILLITIITGVLVYYFRPEKQSAVIVSEEGPETIILPVPPAVSVEPNITTTIDRIKPRKFSTETQLEKHLEDSICFYFSKIIHPICDDKTLDTGESVSDYHRQLVNKLLEETRNSFISYCNELIADYPDLSAGVSEVTERNLTHYTNSSLDILNTLHKSNRLGFQYIYFNDIETRIVREITKHYSHYRDEKIRPLINRYENGDITVQEFNSRYDLLVNELRVASTQWQNELNRRFPGNTPVISAMSDVAYGRLIAETKISEEKS